MWSRYRRRASALSDQLKHKSWSWVPFSRMTRNEKMRVGRFSFLSLKNRKAREKLWKCHESMQKVQNLVTMCRYLHWFQIWPSGGATHIATLHWFAHWAMPNALLASSVELVSSSARKGLSVTSGPIDRTPGIPGSDKKEKSINCDKFTAQAEWKCGLSKRKCWHIFQFWIQMMLVRFLHHEQRSKL